MFNVQAADVIDAVISQHGKVTVALVEEHCAANFMHPDLIAAAVEYARSEEQAAYFAPVQASEFDHV